jgi:hypothetical protein
MRLRNSVSSASGTFTRKGRISELLLRDAALAPVKEVCLSAQPATVFDVTLTQSVSSSIPRGTIVCLGKTGENNPQNFPPGAAIIIPASAGGGTIIFTGETVRIDNSVNGGCPQGVTAIVDSGNPPAGFNIGDTACITFFT